MLMQIIFRKLSSSSTSHALKSLLHSCTLSLSLISPALSRTNIEDVAKTHQFIEVVDLFARGEDKLLCVENARGEYVLWNTTSDEISPPVTRECLKLPGLKRLIGGSIDWPNAETFPTISGPSFGGDFTVNKATIGAGNCGLSYSNYFIRRSSDGHQYGFYIFAKLKTVSITHLNPYCEATEGRAGSFEENFEDIGSLGAVAVGDHKTLFYASRGNLAEPVIILLRDIPDRIWSSGDDLYFIPADVLQPLLNAAGGDPEMRYKALKSVIDRSKQ